MSAKFSAYIGIDYSRAATPMSRSATIQVYEGFGNSDRVWFYHRLQLRTNTGIGIASK